MAVAYLGLGSNMGDKKQFLFDALRLLIKDNKVSIVSVSSLYETKPWGLTEQDIFMNLVVCVETKLDAFELLAHCQMIELELGRVRLVKWGPRVIDVDVLLYDQEQIQTESLIVPHPYMMERDFVMIPLAEIAPNVLIGEQTVCEIAKRFNSDELVIVSNRI
ncbi:MAG TPA: 2-amino-4-hydroxy-6-hydroxymethyldihydropteridine diphosphokinase [Firmicutes bacterium]|nr:2-amino-4-hydroxy-6-hydroxymethyldihydropteridine diphosphokinase [Bacillota bacterium]